MVVKRKAKHRPRFRAVSLLEFVQKSIIITRAAYHSHNFIGANDV
jgi:hypothetical protein